MTQEIDKSQVSEVVEFEAPANDVLLAGEPERNDWHELGFLFQRRWRIMLVTAALTLVIGAAYTCSRRPVYESMAKIVVISSQAAVPAAENDFLPLSDLQSLTRGRSVDTQVEIASSPDLLQEAYGALGRREQSSGFASSSIPGWACSIAARKNTDIITVTARAFNPSAAAALANSVAGTYLRRGLRQNNLAIRQARQYAEEKMILVGNQLNQAGLELSQFQKRSGLFAPGDQTSKASTMISQLALDLYSANTDLATNRRETEALRQRLSHEAPDVVTNSIMARSPQFDAITDKINSLASERIALLQEYTPDSREAKNMDEKIKREQDKLKQVAQMALSSKMRIRNPIRDELLAKYAADIVAVSARQARVRAIEKELTAKRQEVKNLPEREREFNDRVQRVTLLQHTYEMLSNKYYALLLSEQAVLPNGVLVSEARPPSAPNYPNRMKDTSLFLMMGILLAVAAAIVTERLDNRIHGQADVERMTAMTALSYLPLVADDSLRLLTNNERSSPMLESFRILRNNISFSGIGRRLKIIAITSPSRGDGKTTSSVNLAAAMGMAGQRVLLVDGDMRRPALHRLMNASLSSGLTAVLAGTSKLEDAIKPTEIKNVDLLTSGPLPPNPAEILLSQPSRDLFRKLAERYDLVLIDCPPVTGLSDVQVVSTIADGVLLIVSANQTLKPHLYIAVRMLRQVGAPLIGFALNRVDIRRSGYGYYYHYYDREELGVGR